MAQDKNIYNIFDEKMTKITDNIYLGNKYDAQDFKLLKHKKITHILTCQDNLQPQYPNDFNYKVLPLERGSNDTQDIYKYLDDSVEFMNQGVCLVHCACGKDRSPAFVMAYLMKILKLKLQTVKEKVKNLRPMIRVGDNFIGQLEEFEHKLKTENVYYSGRTITQHRIVQQQREQQEVIEKNGKKQIRIKKYFQRSRRQEDNIQKNGQQQEQIETLESIQQQEEEPVQQEEIQKLVQNIEESVQQKSKKPKKMKKQIYAFEVQRNKSDTWGVQENVQSSEEEQDQCSFPTL